MSILLFKIWEIDIYFAFRWKTKEGMHWMSLKAKKKTKKSYAFWQNTWRENTFLLNNNIANSNQLCKSFLKCLRKIQKYPFGDKKSSSDASVAAVFLLLAAIKHSLNRLKKTMAWKQLIVYTYKLLSTHDLDRYTQNPDPLFLHIYNATFCYCGLLETKAEL